MRTTILTGAVAAVAAVAAAPLAGQTVIEPSSKRAFPLELQVPGGMATHVLTGTAIRTKTFLKVQVYAYGMYVDSAGARRVLSAWQGKEAKELEKDDAFYATLLEDNFGKTLRLVMTRDVGGDDFADAFDDALGPRVERAAAERDLPGGLDALQQFRGYFDVEKLVKETELIFTWRPGGTLVTAIGGEVVGELQSPALCWALFDVYLGEKPVMGKGKKTLIERVPEMLGGT